MSTSSWKHQWLGFVSPYQKQQPAEKLEAIFVAFDKERQIPAVGASTEEVDIN